jgi:hypothetical protein
MGNRGSDAGRFLKTDEANNMSTLTIQLPDGAARQLRECAAKEGVTVDQLMSSAAAEKLSAMLTVEHLRERARNAKREDFVAFLNGSPDVPPMPGDKL